MRIALRWESSYSYSQPVRLLHTELRVLPADGHGQRRLGASLRLTPEAHPLLLRDAFGNEYHHADFLSQVERIHVEARAEVETEQPGEAETALLPLMRHLCLAPTARSPHDPAIAALIEPVPPDLGPDAAGEALCAFLHGRFAFEVGRTDVASTALHLLETGGGVCQDFTHLMLAALRLRGIPARYVSGYLAPAVGEGASPASHAWVQLLTPGGWRGFDPANDCRQDGRYVVTAVGRDYDDVPPLRGAYTGAALEHWTALVRVRAERGDPQ